MSAENEISDTQFQQRFKNLGHIVDPFERYFTLGQDRVTHRKVIIKAYYINSQQEQAAILQNLQNYYGLKKVEGLCQIICYTKISNEQLDVAFDFHQKTLEQLFKREISQNRSYAFFVKLLQGIIKLLSQLKQEEVEVDDMRPSNIVVQNIRGEYIFKIFYDERQKNKCISFDGLYLSSERLEEWYTGNFGAFYFQSKIVYECGLMLLDLMTHQIKESLYEDNKELSQRVIEKKLILLYQKYPQKQLLALITKMLSSNSEQRPTLQQLSHQCSTLRNSQYSISSSRDSRSLNKSTTKSVNHSNYISQSSHTTFKQSTNRAQIFPDLDFVMVPANIHPNIIEQLQKVKYRIDKMNTECKRYQDGSVYYGQFIGNIRQGLGIYTYAHGDIFFGNWINNSALQGSYIFQSGQTYEGAVRNGKHGKGLYRYGNGNIYEGYWENDLKQGKGQMNYSNGDRYDGNWHKGKKHGFGCYQYNNGIKYQGNFVEGHKSGICTIVFPDKTRFQGNWSDCCVQGFGKMLYNNGDTFEGNYQQSMRSGRGVFSWPNNITYEGEFFQDTLSGRCLIRYQNGELYDGFITDGVKNGEGMYQYQNGDSFRGVWKNDQKSVGRYTYNEGSVFEGNFKDNAIYYGKMVYLNGDSYEGQFKYGQRDGIGKYTMSNKRVIEGEWRSDSYCMV